MAGGDGGGGRGEERGGREYRLAEEQRRALAEFLRTAAHAHEIGDTAEVAARLDRAGAELEQTQRNLDAMSAMAYVGAAKADVPAELSRMVERGREALEPEPPLP